jgi:1-acyl-sn-glycerol-3-phosphate acyltransferase
MPATPTERPGGLYVAVRALARFWVWFLFKRVEVVHAERVPAAGPALLCINHPNNLIDSLLVGAVLRRKIHYLATAALFRNPVLARFLRACGAIPVYRRQDDPDRMDKNTDTFAACGDALAQGRVVGIYPEGTTHTETRIQRIRTGAARIALEYEARRAATGAPPLTLLPVGLSFEARKSFRGRVRVAFGEPVPVAPYGPAYRDDPVAAVGALTTAIQWAMEAQVLHVERPDRAEIVRVVDELYRGELLRQLEEERGLAPARVDPFRLAQSIADAVGHFEERDPERVARLWADIQRYRALLAAWRVRDEAVRRLALPTSGRALRRSGEASLGLPIFAYGAIVNALPYFLPRVIARRVARKETDYATARLLASVVAFPLFWGLETWIVWSALGVAWGLLFLVSLPVSGLLAYRYLGGVGRLRSQLRFGLLALRQRPAAGRLLEARRAIIAELERAQADYLAATRGSTF